MSFDKSKIIAIVAVIIGVCVVGSIASSKFRGGGADPTPVNPGNVPTVTPTTDPDPGAPEAPSPPPRGTSPPRRSR